MLPHVADLSISNVMWGVASLDSIHTTAKYKYLGRPEKMDIYAPAGCVAPYPEWRGDLVKAAAIPESLIQGTVYLGDFGLAIKAGTSVSQKLQSPAIFCAPERFHNVDPTSRATGGFVCILAQLILGRNLFFGVGAPTVMDSIPDRLGSLPERWKGFYNAGEGKDSWYDQRHTHVYSEPLPAFIDRLRPDMDKAGRRLVHTVLARGLCYLPESRLSAAQLLQDASFCALVAFYGH
jgi:hypothetical protein